MLSRLNGLLSFFNVRIRRIPSYRKIYDVWELMTPYDTNLDLIRVGSKGDGGYVIPELSRLPDYIVSPGIGDNSDFEKYFAEQGVECLMIDGTVTTLPEHHPKFDFIPKNLGLTERENLTTLKEIANSKKFARAVLQMDIEGGEYDALKIVDPTVLSRFELIIIELHGLSRILDLDSGYSELLDLLKKLNRNHICVHAHANNFGGSFTYRRFKLPNIVELTFIKSTLIERKVRKKTSHVPLDSKNNPNEKFLAFPVFPNT